VTQVSLASNLLDVPQMYFSVVMNINMEVEL